MSDELLHKRLDDLKNSMEAHFEQDFMGFNSLASKLDRMDDKLDKHLERITRVEEKGAHQAGQIKLIFSLIISGLSAGVAWILKQFT